MEDVDFPDISNETVPENIFIAPSIHQREILHGSSYTHHSPVPSRVTENVSVECVLGVDEAGRGPVLGPMVYGLLYLPLTEHRSLLADTHHFDDSKVLTPEVRSSLLTVLCTPDTDLYQSCGWATRVMSARDISAGMLKPAGMYNLNAQAMDATIDLIKEVFAKGVNVKEIYIDTIGSPTIYQKKLERIFPTVMITVAKKADSLYPCVSAASICAKVTRDAALKGWGSGYPSDARCTTWLRNNIDPLFGWGNECRFSWGTAKDLLDLRPPVTKIEWPTPDSDESAARVTDFFMPAQDLGSNEETNELATWFGRSVTESVF